MVFVGVKDYPDPPLKKKDSEKVRSFHYLTKRNDAIYMPDQFITSTLNMM